MIKGGLIIRNQKSLRLIKKRHLIISYVQDISNEIKDLSIDWAPFQSRWGPLSSSNNNDNGA